MFARALGALVLATLVLAAERGSAQNAAAKESPVADGRPAQGVDRRPEGRGSPDPERRRLRDRRHGSRRRPAAVPALIEALDDPEAVVRFPVTVALGEIGPGAAAAVPRLKQMMEEELNDEVAAAAKRAIRHIQPSALAGQ